jgi:arylsulfatase A-like enzyme
MGFDEWLSHDNFFEMDPVLSRNGEAPQKYEGEGSEVIVDETIKFIQKSKNQNKPFLAVVWFGSPHEPYSGLPGDLALYENLPDSLAKKEVRLTSNETGEQVIRPLRDVLQERYAEITAMDRAIGTLRIFLSENNLKENTLVMYCGDNGTPPSAARTGLTRRDQKGSLYEGGILVPGVLEWPAVIKEPASTSAVSVTSDILPTLAELTGQPLPDRPIDGVSLVPFFHEPAKQRTEPLYFWQFEPGKVFGTDVEPYIDPKLQEGTTPLAKIMAGKFTRNFRNFKYNRISENDFTGERTMMKDQYKLVLEGQSPNSQGFELYDIENDPGEKKDLTGEHPEMVKEMQADLRKWQESVLQSLTGTDYQQ